MKKKTPATLEMIDDWSDGYAKGELATNHLEEFNELKKKGKIDLLERYTIIRK